MQALEWLLAGLLHFEQWLCRQARRRCCTIWRSCAACRQQWRCDTLAWVCRAECRHCCPDSRSATS